MPQLIRSGCYLLVTEGYNAVRHGRLAVLLGLVGVLLCLAGLLVCGQMLGFPVLFGDPMSVRGPVLQFGGSLMVLVMGCVVLTG